jgi:hypothetical protein
VRTWSRRVLNLDSRSADEFGRREAFFDAAIPLTMWLMVMIGNSSDAAGSLALWVAALTVGGITPAAAGLLALRTGPG